MEGELVNRLQLLEAQVGDLQRRFDSVSPEKILEVPDVQKRLQSLEESMNQQRSSNDERLKVLSSELQQSTTTVMQQLEQHLTSLEEASKQQTQHTESTLKHLAKKVEDSLQNAALEISDAALQNILTQAEKTIQKRGPLRPMPFPDNRVVRQVSNEQWQEWQAQHPQQGQHAHGAGPASVRSMSPAIVRGLSPVMSVPTLRGGMPTTSASLRSLSPETMMAMAMSPRGELPHNRGRSSEPMMRGPIRPEAMRPPPMVNVPQQVSGPAPGRLQSSPRGVPTPVPSGSWLRQVPAALR